MERRDAERAQHAALAMHVDLDVPVASHEAATHGGAAYTGSIDLGDGISLASCCRRNLKATATKKITEFV